MFTVTLGVGIKDDFSGLADFMRFAIKPTIIHRSAIFSADYLFSANKQLFTGIKFIVKVKYGELRPSGAGGL